MTSSRDKRPRQDPVSCELCRTKKLKCNREHPCSNCQARGVTCTLGNAILPTPRTTSHVDTELILSRLDRLEGLLLNNPKIHRKIVSATQSPSASTLSHELTTVDNVLAKTAHDEALRLEGQQLYQTATPDKSSLFKDAYRLDLRTSPVKDILQNVRLPLEGMNGTTLEPSRILWLPPKHEAITFLNDFKNDVEYSHYVVYFPNARDIFEDVYKNIEAPQGIEPSHIGLLFAIFASTACCHSVQNKSRSFFLSDEGAVEVCRLWVRLGCDALEISRRKGYSTIQEVQTAIALFFVVFNLEGYSSVSRSLHTTALSISRDLGLHKTDSLDYKLRGSKESIITKEIKRRLWWHVAATDWLLSVIGGSQEGCYSVNPRQTCVKMPRNITEEDLEREGPDFTRPISEPTEMSYFIQRIRSAELARDTADVWSQGAIDVELMDYNHVIEIDAKFEEFFKEMPVFFRLDHESVRQSYHILKKYPSLVLQRTLVNISVHMRRCKLHQPFLVRGNTDERYRYSREACLRSAREVIESKRRLDREGGSVDQRQLPLNLFVLHHLFIAIIGEEAERREEVAHACRTLEGTRQQGELSKRFLRSLLDVLQKHKINLSQIDHSGTANDSAAGDSTAKVQDQVPHQQLGGQQQPIQPHSAISTVQIANSGSAPSMASGAHLNPSSSHVPDMSRSDYEYSTVATMNGSLDTVAATSLDLEEFWQSYVDQGAVIDASNWDSLFSALEDPTVMPTGWSGVSV